MHEQAKLAEARYFYSRMAQELDRRQEFQYDLSAFLSSARSVLLYARDEAKAKSGGQQWYDAQMTSSPVLAFFKDRRDVNIHIEPVRPIQHTNVTTTVTIHLSVSASVTHRDADGNVLHQSPPETPQAKPREPDTPPVVTTQYKFADWPGSEDVMDLCRTYLDELQQVVADGIARAFLTP